MKKFEFSSKPQPSQIGTFSGHKFYNIYKDADFLRDPDNIETILSKGYELRNMLKNVAPGVTIIVGDMKLRKNHPLLVKNTSGPNVKVEDYEFTNNRLTGMAAAYAFENRKAFSDIKSSEALALGLTWDNTDTDQCRLYLSAVTGTEHFYDQFSFWPIICALRKLQLGKITPELVVKMAKIKNNAGERLAKEFRSNPKVVLSLWKKFPDATAEELGEVLSNAPANVIKAFKND